MGGERIFKQLRDFMVEEISFLMGIYVDINLWLTFSLGSR